MTLYARLAVLLAVLLALGAGAWKIRYGGMVAGRAEVQAKWDTEKQALAELAQRTRANQTEANQRIDRDQQAIKARAALDKRVTDDRLRDFQAAADSGATATGSSGADDPNPRIADQCAIALATLDGYAKGVAGTAKGLQGYTGQVCLGQ